MRLLVKTVLFCSLSYYLICRFKLHFSISLSFSNKNTLFILVNFVLLLMLIIHNFCGTSVTVTNDDLLKEFGEEFAPYQSNAINFQGAVSHSSLGDDDELVEEKSIILVEKYAKEEEETKLEIVLNNRADTVWRQPNLIQKSVHYRSALVVVKDLFTEVKEIVCVDNEFDKLDSDALNRKFDQFISIQKRKWQLDAAYQLLQHVKI